ncbi:MAG TPA: hypothetical protein VMV20_01325 [Chitinophagaceae bacterium]|nr:hypothetical protein [Chitinophagaceae bacterium]
MLPRKRPIQDSKDHGPSDDQGRAKNRNIPTREENFNKSQRPVSKTAMENRIFLLMNMIGATPLS